MSALSNALTASQPTIKEKKSPLSKALQRGDSVLAQEIIKQRHRENCQFSSMEQWQIKVFQDLDFNDEEFHLLSPEIKRTVYRTANNFNKITLVARLNSIGMSVAPFPIKSPEIISESMDCDLAHKTIYDFLIKLRREGRLLSQEEGEQLKDSYRKKNDFTRILGQEHIAKLIERCQFKHIKVPDKIAVMNDAEEFIKVKTSINWNILPLGTLSSFEVEDITIYSKEIKEAKRFISREEILELFTIIDISNYLDLWEDNFLVAEDGIYFIDTGYKSFSGNIDWEKMTRLERFVAQEDQEWFHRLIEEKTNTPKNHYTLQNLGRIYINYKIIKFQKKEIPEKIKRFVINYKDNIKTAKTVGYFNERTFVYPAKAILFG